MSESRSHMELVQKAQEYMETIIPDGYVLLIQTDSPDTPRPENIGGFIPDLVLRVKDKIIIGEAKTIDDFERRHSQNQFEAYLSYCKNFQGKSTLIVSVPWQLVLTAKNYFRRLKNKLESNTEVIVLTETGQWWSI